MLATSRSVQGALNRCPRGDTSLLRAPLGSLGHALRHSTQGHSRPIIMSGAAYLVSDVATYPAKKEELLSAPAPHFVVFSADPHPVTGLPWCGDCVRSLPAVRSVVAASGGSLLEVQVGDRTAWKTPDHPFRTDTSLKLTGIPTVIKLSPSGSEVARLGQDLEACSTPDAAAALLTSFVAATH